MLNPSAADINFIDETESWKHNFQNNKARVEDTLFVVLDGIIKRVLIRKESLPDPQVEKGQTL